MVIIFSPNAFCSPNPMLQGIARWEEERSMKRRTSKDEDDGSDVCYITCKVNVVLLGFFLLMILVISVCPLIIHFSFFKLSCLVLFLIWNLALSWNAFFFPPFCFHCPHFFPLLSNYIYLVYILYAVRGRKVA